MTPYWTNGLSTLYHADAREIPLPDGSVHCAVTSPPYFGLRDYGLGEWQGGDADCGHEREYAKSDSSTVTGGVGNSNSGNAQGGWPNNTCGHCGAVQESPGIGLEPTLAEHIANIVDVFRELRRVLRDDGTAWLNYGDAYAGSWGNYHPTGSGGQRAKETERWDRPAYEDTGRRPAASVPSATGLKPKNLMGLPWRIAFALQDDGWILRSAIVWHKPNPMPESVSTRPTSAYENIFLLAKSNTATYWTHRDQRGTRQRPGADYRWVDAATDTEYSVKPDNVSGEIIECPACDGKGEIVLQDGQVSLFDGVPELVKVCAKCNTECKKCDDPHAGYLHRWKRINLWRSRDYYYDAEAIRQPQSAGTDARYRPGSTYQRPAPNKGWPAERNDGDRHEQPERPPSNGSNARNVWTIPTQGRSDAHFATFPDELPRRCILAGTSERGVCEQCGAPWERVVETNIGGAWHHDWETRTPRAKGTDSAWRNGDYQRQTTGWRPTCDHDAGTVPATVLDPFVGSGTTVAVAQTLGRRGVGVDLNTEYLDIAVKRIGVA